MSLRTAHKFIDLILESTCAKDIGLLFCGGESLLQSARWFYNVIEYANEQATKILNEHHPEYVTEEQAKEIDRIAKAAHQCFVKRSSGKVT